MQFRLFGRDFVIGRAPVIEEPKINPIQEEKTYNIVDRINKPYELVEDGTTFAGIVESVNTASLKDIHKMLDSDTLSMSTLLEAIKMDYSAEETFKENELMSKDTIVGSAMELMADDVSQINPATGKIVKVVSRDKKLEQFLNQFLDNNIKIESKFWEWAFEIIKHGDMKLRRREFETRNGKQVYYENESEGYKVSRIEYMGQVLGYLDEVEGEAKTLEPAEKFVHFMSTKLPSRKKIKVKVRKQKGSETTEQEIVCYKVSGVSLMDNARYIYRVVNLLDDMLIMSRVARSTQFNLVKVEVGNASPRETQQILQDVRRRVEGSTRMNKNRGMRTDPSPIPINANVYIPIREGKGDIQIDSVNESIDVRSITDIDYFRNKQFATLRTPKAFLGFEEELPGGIGNTTLTRLDIRYSRTVQRVHTILKEGIVELCNNYLTYRGRESDIGKFEVSLRKISSAEDNGMFDDIISKVSIFDALASMSDTYKDFIDRAKMFIYLANLAGLDIRAIGNKTILDILNKIEKSEETEETTASQQAVDGEEDTEEEDTGDFDGYYDEFEENVDFNDDGLIKS